MTEQNESGSRHGVPKKDLTGQNRVVRNVVWSWAGHMVFIVIGFIMPRLIDEQVGQFALGIWDFCWSMVSYLNMASLGVGSSTNRYVAKYRAAGDTLSLRRAISSVIAIQLIVSLIMTLALSIIVWLIPPLFGDRLGAFTEVTRWVVALLGGSIVVQMCFDAFRGVMTGCHRWDLYNGIQAGSYALVATVMAVALLMGGGLLGIAAVYFFGTVLTEMYRMMMAFRICSELSVGMSYVRWAEGKKMLLFGGKSLLLGSSNLIVVQTTNIIVASTLGPAALAVFSRPMGLVRHLETFLHKFSHVFTPMAGSLQGQGDVVALRELFVDGARYGVAFSLPLVLLLSVMGDALLTVWMGPDYAHGELVAILAIGLLLPIAQGPVVRVLMGLNMHGKVGLVGLIATLGILAAGFGIIGLIGWTLVNAALLTVVPLLLVYGIILPVYACHRLEVPVMQYARRAFVTPLWCNLAFLPVLFAGRSLFAGNELLMFFGGGLLGAMVLLPLYWRFIVPPAFREKILRKIPFSGLARKRPTENKT